MLCIKKKVEFVYQSKSWRSGMNCLVGGLHNCCSSRIVLFIVGSYISGKMEWIPLAFVIVVARGFLLSSSVCIPSTSCVHYSYSGVHHPPNTKPLTNHSFKSTTPLIFVSIKGIIVFDARFYGIDALSCQDFIIDIFLVVWILCWNHERDIKWKYVVKSRCCMKMEEYGGGKKKISLIRYNGCAWSFDVQTFRFSWF